MPSWRIHEKYGRLMGLPLDVVKEINRLVDDVRMHDFYDSFLSKYETPSLRFLGGRIILYRFSGALFYTPTWDPLRRAIEKHGDAGWKAFFLHIWLDLFERNMRSGKGFTCIRLEAVDYYKEYIDEVGMFLQNRINEVVSDIWRYIRKSKHSF